MTPIPTVPPPEQSSASSRSVHREWSVTHHPPRERAASVPATQPRRPIDRRVAALLFSFRCAFAGVWYLFSTQRNAQIHALIGACALALGGVLGLARWEWLMLVLTIALVLAAEGVNTAVEAAVDVATSSYHPLARVAKDVAAGAVLISACAAVIVGCIIFLPHLWPLLTWLLDRR